MIYRIADNIVCPLGSGSANVYEAMKEGRYSSRLHDGQEGGIEPYFASVFEEGRFAAGCLADDGAESLVPGDNAGSIRTGGGSFRTDGVSFRTDGMTRLESLMAESVAGALEQLVSNGFRDFDTASSRVIFIVSTTKGNIGLLKPEDGFSNDGRLLLSHSADVLAKAFSNPNRPLTVSNACISGLSAQIVADRLLSSGKYDFAVVTGADLLCPFIISGFQSFRALSAERARSFDVSRTGLNLGEAAATIIYASTEAAVKVGEAAKLGGKYITMAAGSIANDATHISAPSRTGEGLFRTLSDLSPVLEGHKVGLICAHGTATAYNDAMEAVAISRASLEKVPVNSLKGYIGHTLGAAGVIESIIPMYEMCFGEILPVPGFHEIGVPVPLDVVSAPRHFNGDAFIKTVSGFGGCNASAVFIASEEISFSEDKNPVQDGPVRVRLLKNVRLDVSGNDVNGMYRDKMPDYPKFFKMDMLSRLGFMAAEQLLEGLDGGLDDAAIILAGRHASLDDDVKYMATITPGDYYPSPALFVYTLANIVAGEIAIKHGIHGETTFYIEDAYDRLFMETEAERIIGGGRSSKVIFGWVDWYDGKGCADLSLMAKA